MQDKTTRREELTQESYSESCALLHIALGRYLPSIWVQNNAPVAIRNGSSEIPHLEVGYSTVTICFMHKRTADRRRERERELGRGEEREGGREGEGMRERGREREREREGGRERWDGVP